MIATLIFMLSHIFATTGVSGGVHNLMRKLTPYTYCSFKMFSRWFFANKKLIITLGIWRRYVECNDLTFCMQRVMLRATRRRKRAFV